MFNLRRKLALKRARIALDMGNLDGAYIQLRDTGVMEYRRGQMLAQELARALGARARKHAACANWPEAHQDARRALEFGGAAPDVVRLCTTAREHLAAAPSAADGDALPPPRRLSPAANAPSSPREAPGAARRFVLWVDGIGTFVVIAAPRAVVGRYDASARPDIPLPGRLSGRAGEILRVDDRYVLRARDAAEVNGKSCAEKVLAPGDRIAFGASPAFSFYLPCPLSATALLRLDPPSMLPGKASDILLLDRFLVLGRKGLAHIKAPGGPLELLVFLRDGVPWARTAGTLLIDGAPSGTGECALPLGVRIAAEDLSFTVTGG